MEKGKKYLLGIFVAIIIVYNISDYFVVKKEAKIATLTKDSEDINKRCPFEVNEYTVLDSTTVTHEPVSINYFYTVNVNKDSLRGLESIKAKIIQANQAKLDNEASLQWLRDEKILMTHHYKDWKGQVLFDYSITPTNKTEE